MKSVPKHFWRDVLEREHRKKDASWAAGVYFAWFPVMNAEEGRGGEPFTDKGEHWKIWVHSRQLYQDKAQGKFKEILFHQKRVWNLDCYSFWDFMTTKWQFKTNGIDLSMCWLHWTSCIHSLTARKICWAFYLVFGIRNALEMQRWRKKKDTLKFLTVYLGKQS